MLLFAGTGLLIAALGVPLALRRVRPNHLYGLRVSQTLTNDTIWYEANALSGALLVAAGLIVTIGSLLVFALGVPEVASALINTAVLLVAVLFVCIKSARVARDMEAAKGTAQPPS